MAQIRFIAQIVVGLLMGTVFYNLGNEASKVTSNTSFLFFSLMFIFFSNSMPTVQSCKYFFLKLIKEIGLNVQ